MWLGWEQSAVGRGSWCSRWLLRCMARHTALLLPRRQAIKSHEEGVQELVWAEKIIGHLIKKEGVSGPPREGEQGGGGGQGQWPGQAAAGARVGV